MDGQPGAYAAAVPGAWGAGQRRTALALLGAVVLLDQTTKWWGWRHASRAIINPGATWFVGQPVDGWFSGATSGALLDLLGVGGLSIVWFLLVRRRRRGLVLVSGVLMTGGWGSNLLDRLGLHALTAPGSVRGAADFIHLGPAYFNVADFVIVGATLVFLLTTCVRRLRLSTAVARMQPSIGASRYLDGRRSSWPDRRGCHPCRLLQPGAAGAICAVTELRSGTP
jgi:lipoprotein signal peptidase